MICREKDAVKGIVRQKRQAKEETYGYSEGEYLGDWYDRGRCCGQSEIEIDDQQ